MEIICRVSVNGKKLKEVELRYLEEYVTVNGISRAELSDRVVVGAKFVGFKEKVEILKRYSSLVGVWMQGTGL